MKRHPSTLLLLLLALLLAVPEAQAQLPGMAPSQVKKTRVGFSFSLAPTVNWLNDVDVRLRELQENPQNVDPDSLESLFNQGEFPAQIGFEAGLALTLSHRWLGLRAGATFLNTGGVFDGANYLNEENLRENFVVFELNLQLRHAAGPAVFYAFGGPEFRYHLDLSDEEEINLSTFRENMEPLSTAATFGAGVELYLMGTRIAPEVRYAMGLSGVSGRTFEAEGVPFELSDEYRLNNLAFGLLFGL